MTCLTLVVRLLTEVVIGAAAGGAISTLGEWLLRGGWVPVTSAEPVHDLMCDYWDGYPAEWFDDGWVGGWRPSLTEILPDAKPVPW